MLCDFYSSILFVFSLRLRRLRPVLFAALVIVDDDFSVRRPDQLYGFFCADSTGARVTSWAKPVVLRRTRRSRSVPDVGGAVDGFR